MNKRRSGSVALLALGFILGGLLQPFHWAPTFAQGDCRAFPETGKQVCGRFLQYWTTNGGLAQQGLPLTNEFPEASDLNGKSYTVQYFERAVFEKHPENAAPYDVLLSQLGTFRLKAKYPGGDPSGLPAPTATAIPPQPAPTALPDIHSQTVDFPSYGNTVTLRGTVTDVKEAQTIPPASAARGGTAHGKFVMVYLTVINTGKISAELGDNGIKLRDGQGRTFDTVGDFEVWYAAVKAGGFPTYLENVQPGVPTPVLYVFDIPQDVNDYYLVAAGQ